MLLRTAFAGLCHSDLHFMEGLYPFPTPCVLGHEGAAVVEAVGEDVTYVKPGDHVITCLSVFCGECPQCLTGHPNLCENTEVKLLPGAARRLTWKGEVLNQAFNLSVFAEKMLVHEHAMVKIDESIPLDSRGAGRLRRDDRRRRGVPRGESGARQHRRRGRLRRHRAVGGERRGAGRRGEDHRDRYGAVEAGEGEGDGRHRHDQRVQCRSGGGGEGDDRRRGVPYSFEAIGTKKTAEQSFEMLRPGGVATIIGMIPFGMKIELHGADFLRDRKIQGTSMGGNRFRVDMPRLLELWRQGRLKLDTLISGRIKLDRDQRGVRATEVRRAGAAVDRFRRRLTRAGRADSAGGHRAIRPAGSARKTTRVRSAFIVMRITARRSGACEPGKIRTACA